MDVQQPPSEQDLRPFQAVGAEIYALLQQLDPARWREEHRPAALKTLKGLGERARGLADGDDVTLATWGRKFSEAVSQSDQCDEPELRELLTTSYDNLQERLKERGLEVHRHRPTNYLRNLYHIANGAMIIGLIQYVLTPVTMVWVAGGFTALAWTCEASRRLSPAVNRVLMRLFRDVAHPDEHYTVNSATWMCTALLLISLLFSPIACTVGVAILGFADPMAALVGRRYGKRKLYQSKTLEGALGFFVTAFLVTAVICWSFGATSSLGAAAIVAFCAATPTTLGELYAALLIDDNFVIPTLGATGASLSLQLVTALSL